MNKKFLTGLLITSTLISCTKKEPVTTEIKEVIKPNIVIVYLDDLGYGDVGAYGATEIKTPNIDKLANEGLKFTNGYATSATCTPSRYGLLTGIYPWRNKDARILPGTAPLIISPEQETLPKLLKRSGYQTAVIGKWHLGLGTGYVNWNEHVSPGPNEVGFDESYILAATQDRVPTVYIDNGDVVGLDKNDPIEVSYSENFEGQPTGLENPELTTMKWHHGHNGSIVNGIPRIGFMKGGEAAKWSDVDMADHFLLKVKEYIKTHKDKPFFLYYALQQPHVPRTPNPRFVGRSGLGPRGDVIVEADWVIGEFMKTLEDEGVLENTLIVFSSDNGPVLNDGYYDDAVEKLGNHDPKGGLRGGKYSLFEAGTKVPFITYWKGQIQPGVSDAVVSQLDLLASLNNLVGGDFENTQNTDKKIDSKDYLNVFLGKESQGRTSIILEANMKTALRKGDWILIPPHEGNAVYKDVQIETGILNEYQLYNIKEDPSQQNNLASIELERLEEMKHLFNEVRGEYKKKDDLVLH